MSDAVLVSLITGGLASFTAIAVLVVGWALNRNNARRAEQVKTALDTEATKVRQAVEDHSLSSSIDASAVVEALTAVRAELKDFRSDFKTYREDHAREHRLINDKILHP